MVGTTIGTTMVRFLAIGTDVAHEIADCSHSWLPICRIFSTVLLEADGRIGAVGWFEFQLNVRYSS